MSIQFLNDIITDDILDKKIRENEANIQALEKMNNLEEIPKDDINIEEGNNFNKNIVGKKINEKTIISTEINKKDSQANNIDITPIKKENKINEKENNSSSSSNKINITTNISNTNISNMNKNRINDKKDNSINYSKKNFNKINRIYIYSPSSEKRRNIKKKEQNNFLYDNIDQSLYYQYTTLFSNQKIRNKSADKRPMHEYKNFNDNKEKNNSRSKDINEDMFSSIYKRFADEEKKQKEKLEKMKKNKEEQEKKKFLYKPQINKKSKEITSKNKEDFITRQKKLMEEKKKKDIILREKVKKKEKDEINKNNILLSHNHLSKNEKNKNKKKSIDETINKLFEWEDKRKEKINNKIKSKEYNMDKNINNKDNLNINHKIKVKRNPKKLINRLYKVDIAKRKERQEILNQIYTPSFQPFLFENNNSSQINKNKNKVKNKDKNSNNNYGLNKKNPNIFSSDCLITNNNNIEDTSSEEDKNNNNLDDLIRNHVFGKIKSKARYRSAMKFNVIKDENIKNDFIDDDEDNYFNKDLDNHINNKKISTSFIRRIKKKIDYY